MKKNIGLLGEIQEELRKSEEGRKRLFSDLQQREAEAQKRTQDILLGREEKNRNCNHPAASRNGTGNLAGDRDSGQCRLSGMSARHGYLRGEEKHDICKNQKAD